MQHFVVMGVSGCGKSTVAESLSRHVNGRFIEADDLHGSANVSKMARGEPLNDEDRWPWLRRVAKDMQVGEPPVVVSCSCLKHSYRTLLREEIQAPIGFIHLHTTAEVIASRLSERRGHFMPTSLLDSQVKLLEPLQSDEEGIVIDIERSLEYVVGEAIDFVNLNQRNLIG